MSSTRFIGRSSRSPISNRLPLQWDDFRRSLGGVTENEILGENNVAESLSFRYTVIIENERLNLVHETSGNIYRAVSFVRFFCRRNQRQYLSSCQRRTFLLSEKQATISIEISVANVFLVGETTDNIYRAFSGVRFICRRNQRQYISSCQRRTYILSDFISHRCSFTRQI